MACGCRGTCVKCLGSYRPAEPLAFNGWRLRVPGNPPGGQYHGYLGAAHGDGVYRSPGEIAPRMNANGGENLFRVQHSRRQAGYAVSPGAYRALGTVPAVPVSNLRNVCPAWGCDSPIWGPVHFQGPGATSWIPQPMPPVTPAPAPIVSNSNCPAGQFRDSAGNCVSDWHNPYVLYLPQSPSPSPSVATPTSATPSAGQMPASSGGITEWLSASSLITGFPNWGLVAAGVGVLFLMKGRR